MGPGQNSYSHISFYYYFSVLSLSDMVIWGLTEMFTFYFYNMYGIFRLIDFICQYTF